MVSRVASGVFRDIHLVKAQLGEDCSSLRFLKLSKTHITLNGLICAARDVFFESEKEFPADVKSVLVQFRDKDGDFVMLRDDTEIQLLDILSLLNQTMFRFILLGKDRKIVMKSAVIDKNGDRCMITHTDLGVKNPGKTENFSKDLQTVSKKLTTLETMITQLSANFALFRNQALQDMVEIKQHLEVEKISAQTQRSKVDMFDDSRSESMLDEFSVLGLPNVPSSTAYGQNSSSQIGLPCVKFFDSFYSGNGDVKVTLEGKVHGEHISVYENVFHKAVAAAEEAENGNEAVEFTRIVLETTAREVCDCSFGLVLQDIQKSTRKEIIQAFYSPAGNKLLKVLHHWASNRWSDSPKRNRFTQMINGWLRSVFYGSSYHPKGRL